MKIIKFSELIGHDVYEFSYGYNYGEFKDNHWSEDSLYVSDEDFNLLSKYIDITIKNFNYYGLNKIKFTQWEQIKNIVISTKNNNRSEFENFFNEVDKWIALSPQDLDYFWIWGL